MTTMTIRWQRGSHCIYYRLYCSGRVFKHQCRSVLRHGSRRRHHDDKKRRPSHSVSNCDLSSVCLMFTFYIYVTSI